jgi:hypothetical protein
LNNIILAIDYLIWGLLIYIKKLKALTTHLARIDELAALFFQKFDATLISNNDLHRIAVQE